MTRFILGPLVDERGLVVGDYIDHLVCSSGLAVVELCGGHGC